MNFGGHFEFGEKKRGSCNFLRVQGSLFSLKWVRIAKSSDKKNPGRLVTKTPKYDLTTSLLKLSASYCPYDPVENEWLDGWLFSE